MHPCAEAALLEQARRVMSLESDASEEMASFMPEVLRAVRASRARAPMADLAGELGPDMGERAGHAQAVGCQGVAAPAHPPTHHPHAHTPGQACLPGPPSCTIWAWWRGWLLGQGRRRPPPRCRCAARRRCRMRCSAGWGAPPWVTATCRPPPRWSPTRCLASRASCCACCAGRPPSALGCARCRAARWRGTGWRPRRPKRRGSRC